MKIENLAQQNRRLLRITCRVENFLGIEERLFILSSSEPGTLILFNLLMHMFILITFMNFYSIFRDIKQITYYHSNLLTSFHSRACYCWMVLLKMGQK